MGLIPIWDLAAHRAEKTRKAIRTVLFLRNSMRSVRR